jgi:hypothetical protein
METLLGWAGLAFFFFGLSVDLKRRAHAAIYSAGLKRGWTHAPEGIGTGMVWYWCHDKMVWGFELASS